MNTSVRPIAGIALCIAAGMAAGQARLDTGASPQQQVRAELEWTVPLRRAAGVSDKAFRRMTAQVRALDIRLDTARFVGREARIYMTLPLPVQGLSGTSGLRLDWRSEGVFEDGSLVPGERTLLFAGPVSEPELRDRLHLQIEVDSDAMTGGEIRFEPGFLIEPF